MDSSYEFEYFYGPESEEFSFLMVPKFLLREGKFESVSDSAKILYSEMLERMGLSRKNGWFDDQDRPYIYYSVEDAMADINRSRPTAIKALKELETLGLIERIKQGQGKPTIVYVKRYMSRNKPANPDKSSEVKNLYFKKSNTFTSRSKESLPQEVKDAYSKESNVLTSGSKETELQEVKSFDPNNTEINNTYRNDNQSYQYLEEKGIDANDDSDPVILQERWTEYVKDNIGYEALVTQYPYKVSQINEFVRIMVMVICFGREPYNINGCSIPAKLVRAQFEKLEFDHIEYVLQAFDKASVPITAPDAYIIAALYSSYNTIDNGARREVNHDRVAFGQNVQKLDERTDGNFWT